MSFQAFFRDNPLFHREELEDYLRSIGSFNPSTLKSALQYHLAQKHLAHIRRGYYLVTTDYLGSQVENDHLLIASRLAKDAVISYYSAMNFHSLSYSVNAVTYFNSDKRIGFFSCDYGQYSQVSHPVSLKPADIFMETGLHDRMGMDVRVTTIERTLADSLHRPNLAGGWEEIWRSFESVDFLDVDRLVSYSVRLGNATTVAKVGFFLEQHQEQFSVKECQLFQLEKHRPKAKHYMEKGCKGQVKSLKRWNLIVPNSIAAKEWEEPNSDSV
jgi:predicted transcriptional regulator of viral defense system